MLIAKRPGMAAIRSRSFFFGSVTVAGMALAQSCVALFHAPLDRSYLLYPPLFALSAFALILSIGNAPRLLTARADT
jgi:hypothetical protein